MDELLNGWGNELLDVLLSMNISAVHFLLQKRVLFSFNFFETSIFFII